MNVLITGASGMLGQALMKRLAGRHAAAGVSKSGRMGAALDLADEKAVHAFFEKAPSFGLVIHTAAYSDVDGCERDPRAAHEANGIATKNLARACESRGIPFVYVSTDYVFDGRKCVPYLESDPTAPVNVYGMTKLEGESYTALSSGRSAIVRTSWLFGAGNPKNFVNAIITRLGRDKAVKVLADQEDSPTYVEDLAAALERIGERLAGGEGPKHEIFQFCNSGSTTRYEMTAFIRDFLGFDALVEKMDKSEFPDRPAIRPAYGVLSTRHYEEVFGVFPRPWEEALEEYLDEYVP